jgi:hypothetical protein
MKKDSRHIWYLVDLVIFSLINILIWIYFEPLIFERLSEFDWSMILLFAAGIYRLTDIITQESVTEIFRIPFMDVVPGSNPEKLEVSKEGFRGVLGVLVSCNSCAGVWVSMIVFYCFVFFPTPTIAFMIIMTLTFFERFFSKIYNVLEKRG